MTRRNSLTLGAALIISAVMSVSGCSSVKDALGTTKYPPDEFTVVAKTPLIIPPDYNLRPPGASNPSPHEVDSSQAALEALFPGATSVLAAASPGENTLLRASGADRVDTDTRSDLVLGTTVIGKGAFTEDILFSDKFEGSDGVSIERSPIIGEATE